MSEKICKVEVKREYLEKVSHPSPEKALAKIIWNSLDADAMHIEILFTENDFGVLEISLKDVGVGFSIAEAETLFTSLGESWISKKLIRRYPLKIDFEKNYKPKSVA